MLSFILIIFIFILIKCLKDICEDPEIRERIEQLKNEQEIKKLVEAQKRRIRRSQSNTR